MAAPTFKAGSAASDTWGGSNTHSTPAYTIAALTNGYLIVGFGAWTGTPPNVVSVTWGGGSQALASLGTRQLSGDGDSMEIWGLKNPTAATGTLDIVWDVDPGSTAIVYMCYEGVDQTTPIRVGSYNGASGAGGSPATATVNISATADDMVVAFMWNDLTASFTETGSQNKRTESSTGVGTLAAFDLVATGASTTMAATYTGGDKWIDTGVALAQIGGAPGPSGLMWL